MPSDRGGERMIENAKIVNTMLGYEGHGIETFSLELELETGSISYGGYVLGSPGENHKRIGTAFGMTAIFELMNVVGVSCWEQLKGKYCRVELESKYGPVKRIGNLLKNEWYDLSEILERTRK